MAGDERGIELPMSMSGVPPFLMLLKLVDFLVEKRLFTEADKHLFYSRLSPLFEVSNPDMQAVKQAIDTIMQRSE